MTYNHVNDGVMQLSSSGMRSGKKYQLSNMLRDSRLNHRPHPGYRQHFLVS
jgi:hypothetical protein